MGYDIYLISEEKKEFARTKANGEDKDYLIDFLKSYNYLTIAGENSQIVEDILYTVKGNEYTEINVRTLKPYEQ